MSQTQLLGGVDVGSHDTGHKDGPVFSTGCLLVAFAVVFVVVIVIPALIWTAGILFGQ